MVRPHLLVSCSGLQVKDVLKQEVANKHKVAHTCVTCKHEEWVFTGNELEAWT